MHTAVIMAKGGISSEYISLSHGVPIAHSKILAKTDKLYTWSSFSRVRDWEILFVA
jgi:hypothetical protein